MSIMNDSDLIPRPDVQGSLVDALRQGSVLFYGPRRVGKSTMLEQLAASPPAGLVLLRIDLEGFIHDPIGQLAEQIHHKLRASGLIRGIELADRVEGIQAAGLGVTLNQATSVGPWEHIRDDLVQAASSIVDTTLIVALDEVPWWLDAIVERDGSAAGRAALAALRRLRQDRGLSDRLRMVLTGSIGLAGYSTEILASAELNDLTTIVMPPMSRDEGATLFEIEMTARGLPCSAPAANWATDLAGGSPYWIKCLATNCGASGADDTGAIDAAVDALLVPALRKQFADEGRDHFRRRHRRVMPALLAMLESVSGNDAGNPLQATLNAAAKAQPELTRGDVKECVHLLMDGFYLRDGPDNTVEWVNPLFRRWWVKYGEP